MKTAFEAGGSEFCGTNRYPLFAGASVGLFTNRRRWNAPAGDRIVDEDRSTSASSIAVLPA
jgi:hypothetical protein